MMRVIRWKNASTGVESLNITATGIYFPVGKTDSSFIARYSMASAEQTASVERVSSPNGSRVGSPAINVSGTTEVVVNERGGLSTGIIVTAISGTLISVLDDNTPITDFPDAGLGRFPAKEDADAYVYGSTVPQGISAIINGVPYSWRGAGVGWGKINADPLPVCQSATLGIATLAHTSVDSVKNYTLSPGVNSFRLIYRNYAPNGTTEVESYGDSSAIITASVEFGGENYPVTFGGLDSGNYGRNLESDAVTIPETELATNIKVHTRCVMAGNTPITWSRISGLSDEGYVFNAASLVGTVGTAGYTTGSPERSVVPALIIGNCASSIGVIGDSIAFGDVDTPSDPINKQSVRGWVRRWSHSKIGLDNYAFPGSKIQLWNIGENVSQCSWRALSRFMHRNIILAYGTNDLSARTVAQIVADYKALISRLRKIGAKNIIVPTILPRATSTDGWTTLVNQTPVAGWEVGGKRDQLNAWIMSGGDGCIDAPIDICSVVAVGALWQTGSTNDSVHPNQLGSQRIVQALPDIFLVAK